MKKAERQGFEPWQRLRVDRLAICSITTLAPLRLVKFDKNIFSNFRKQYFLRFILGILPEVGKY